MAALLFISEGVAMYISGINTEQEGIRRCWGENRLRPFQLGIVGRGGSLE